MRRNLALLAGMAVIFAGGFVAGTKLSPVQAKDKPGTGFRGATRRNEAFKIFLAPMTS